MLNVSPITRPHDRMSTTSVCAALVTVLPGDEGTALFRESIMSVLALSQITKIFLADVDNTPRSLAELMPSVDADKCVSVRILCMPGVSLDAAFANLAQAAEADGCTHGLIMRSVELLKRTDTGSFFDSLPDDWESADVMQTVSNVKFRSTVDVIVRLNKFTFLGPMLPAPVPVDLCTLHTLVARPWPGSFLDANTYKVTRAQAHTIIAQIRSALTLSSYAHQSFHAGLLRNQLALALWQAEDLEEADSLFSQRVKEHTDGWAEEDGLYLALLARCRLAHQMKIAPYDVYELLLETASTGLSASRFEGLLALHVALNDERMQEITTLALHAAGTCPWLHNNWMGDGAAQTYLLRENIGVGVYRATSAGMQECSHEQLYAAHRHPGSRLVSRVKKNYEVVAQPGDSMAIVSKFPSVSCTLMPQFLLYAQFVTDADAPAILEVFKQQAGLHQWAWLKILLQNAVRTSDIMTWGKTATMATGSVTTSMPILLGGNWFNQRVRADQGYAFLLPLRLCAEPVILVAHGQAGESTAQHILQVGSLYCIRATHDFEINKGTGDVDILYAQLHWSAFL